MACWPGLVVVLALCIFSYSDATVTLEHNSASVVIGKRVTVKCTVTTETFDGWYKGSSRIQQDSSNAQIYFTKDSNTEYSLVFRAVAVDEGGPYVCKGSTGKSTFTLNVAFDSSKVEKTQYLRVGTDGKITVGVFGFPALSFEWRKNGAKFDPNTGRYRSQSDGSILVSDIEAVDAGHYTLKITQGVTSLDIKIEVIAFEPPNMVEVPLPATRYLTVGFNTTFHCLAKGTPPPTYQWLNRIGKPIDITNPRFVPDGEYFYITNIQESDKGTYTCMASNAKGFTVNASAEIKEVYVRPTIQSQYIIDEIVEHGERATLDCVADGKPLPTVRWMRDGRIEYRQKLSSRRSVIRIQEARMMDMGKYQCEAFNLARDQDGNIIVAEETMGLYIRSKPVLNKKGTQLTVYSYLGNPKPVFIRCAFEGYPFPNVTIWYDNIQIANGTEVAIFDIITNELDEDFGDYYCWSWNLHGSTNVTVSLKHATAPSRPTSVVANVTCNSVMLTWDFPKDYGGMEIVQYVIQYDKVKWNTKDSYPVYFIENLKPDTVYTIKIQARNKMGVGDHETVTVTTNQFCRPSHPLIWNPRKTIIEDTVFFLRWREPDNDGGDPNMRYYVKISESIDDVPYPFRDEWIGVTEYFVDELKFGMKYQVEVVAFNKGGYSDPAIGLYEIPKLAVMSALAASSCLLVNALTILLASLLTLTLTNL